MNCLKFKNLVLLLFVIILCSCSSGYKRKYKVRKVKFIKTEYNKIVGWKYDSHIISLNTFSNSCKKILKISDTNPISKSTRLGGNARNWKRICQHLNNKKFKTNEQAKRFFEKWFTPYIVLDGQSIKTGKFTGYYEIEINGSTRKTRRCRHPVYMPPKNLSQHQRKNYLSHSSINKGSLKGKNLEILWVDNHARLYFMHVQGSGRIKLNDGRLVRLGYAGENGHDYKSIGPYFKEYNATGINSALDMIEWLHRNPRDSREIIERNQSYVFFRKINGNGPIGAQGIPLTPERSIAIDKAIYPYGTPIWIDTSLPKTRNYIDRKYRRLFVAQDTGGAIKGAIRGDIFFGHGKRGEELACYMNNKGKQYALFPKSVKIPNYYRTH
ncbi:MAG: murein transglycosylase A [Candidatus Midichloriaceae bacterium]